MDIYNNQLECGICLDYITTNKMDDRKNAIKSTQIAIKYLKYLHNELNDWNLTLAAYNWGIGSVKKALKRGSPSSSSLFTKDLSLVPFPSKLFLL